MTILSLGADAGQQGAGWFVGRVLRQLLAAEGGAQEVLALGGGLLEGVLDGQLLIVRRSQHFGD